MKQVLGMRKRSTSLYVELNKGYISHIIMSKVDQTKADGKNLTLVVVDISKRGRYSALADNNGFI